MTDSKQLKTVCDAEKMSQEDAKLFSNDEYKVVTNLRSMIVTEAVNEILGRYRIAKYVKEVWQQRSAYNLRDGFLERLAQALGYKTANPIYEMLKVAEKWKSEEELKESVLNKLSIDLTWKELVYIARLEKEEDVKVSLLEFNKNKSIEEVRETLGKEKKRKGRTLSKNFTSPLFCLKDLTKHLNDFSRRLEEVFLQTLKIEDIENVYKNSNLKTREEIENMVEDLKGAVYDIDTNMIVLRKLVNAITNVFYANSNEEEEEEYEETERDEEQIEAN
ncbi:MAG: hypothetical protein QW303_00165 [Nitrososphaerota archaeon]